MHARSHFELAKDLHGKHTAKFLDYKHHDPRPISNKWRTLRKRLGFIKAIQSQQKSPVSNQPAADSANTIMEQNKENTALCNAILGLDNLSPDLPFLQQIEEMLNNTKRAMNYIDEKRNKESNNIACKQLNKLINKDPRQAHKAIFYDKKGQPRVGLQALRVPGTKKRKTSKLRTATGQSLPGRQAQIFDNYYTEAMKAVNIEKGKYLPEAAPRNYPWEQSGKPEPVPILSPSNPRLLKRN
eukprot:1142201-Pelagomonas_calceolata.AAC.2